MKQKRLNLLGIDTGGTFTDFVYFDGQQTLIHKVLSTPAAPEKAILQGMEDLGLGLAGLRVIHGSTVATNALLERKGAKTVFITNRGLKDLLSIGRQARRELYQLQPQPVAPPVPAAYLLETGGRLSAFGEIIEPLTEDDLACLVREVNSLQPEAVAINLLFSFLDDRFEKKIAAAMPRELFVSCSSAVLPELREYERGITTWLNAYVGPLVQGYLKRLGDKIAPAKLSVMRSSGDICAAQQAGREAVHLLLSGPAAGLAGARYVAATTGVERIMTLDMGGTSTDVALIDGAITLTGTGEIANYPVGVPMVDMHTIGAGGGSIAYVDAGGGLQVGPESAGANPGPVCYGQGGNKPTVTDANLILGHLPATTKLGGGLALDFHRSHRSLTGLAEQLGLPDAETTAAGIIEIVNEQMAQALRVISVQRGIDPREFTLLAFGGAGGMHVCALADALEMRRAMAPVQSGVLSALGMLVAPAGRQLSRTLGCLLKECDMPTITAHLTSLSNQGRSALIEQGVIMDNLVEEPSLDLCYRGQAHTLNIPWGDISQVEKEFHEKHESVYGHRLDAPVELVNIRLSIRSYSPSPQLPEIVVEDEATPQFCRIYACEQPARVLRRYQLPRNQQLNGPAVVIDTVSTTYVAPAWRCHVDSYGNLLLEK